MINKVSYVQNYNFYSYNQRKYNNTTCSANINFKSSSKSIRKTAMALTLFPASIAGLFNAFKGKNKFDAEEYFYKVWKMPTTIYFPDKEPIQNPELQEYVNKLDNLTKKQKKEFVRIFCEKTGFPNLDKVQEKMDNEILRAIAVAFAKTDNRPVFAAYSSNCSVGKSTALPGSDCDGLFIVAAKPLNLNEINRFKIGTEINQRILETQGSHFPELFSIDELIPYIELSNKIFEKIKTEQKIENYEKNLLRSDQDFVKAGEFNIDIESYIKDENTKNMLYLTAFFVEEYRAGHILLNYIDNDIKDLIETSAMYKYSNVVRQEGFKNNSKPKWDNRIKMCSEFESKSDDEKFKICSEILKSTMGVKQENISGSYDDFDMGNILDLIDILTSFRKYLNKWGCRKTEFFRKLK